MDRRTFAKRALVAAVGGSALGGCTGAPLGDSPDGDGGDGTGGPETGTYDPSDFGGSEWQHGVGGRVDAVVDGTVFGREAWEDEDADGGVFALDAETGDRRWTYGKTGGYTLYTEPAVDDALFFGFGTDAVGDGSGKTYALEFDGEERWTADTGSVYERPRLVDGVAYVGGDDGVVRAFDVENGEERWSNDRVASGGPSQVDVVGVSDVVYAATGQLVALDTDGGSVLWRYGEADGRIRSARIADGVAYVTDRDGVAAVSEGERRWHVPFEHNRWIRGLESERLLVRHRWDLHALDTADGEERWIAENVENLRIDTHAGSVYVGGDRLTARDAADGSERWTETVGDGEAVESVTAVGDDARDHSLFVHTGEDRIARLDSTGDETWSETVDGRILNYLVDGSVFVGSSERIHSLVPE